MRSCANPNCQKPTTNPRFCSKSCAAQVTNREHPRRKKAMHPCATCGTEIPARNKYCSLQCMPWSIEWNTVTIGQMRGIRKYQRSSRIRDLSREWFLKTNPRPVCAICGYDKHVEVCHIRSVDSFPPDTLVTVVNAESNLIGLCPNHHWELDAGLLEVPAQGLEP